MIMGIIPIKPMINDGITKEIKEIIILIATNNLVLIFVQV